MEGEGHLDQNDMHFTPLGSNGYANFVSDVAENHPHQQYVMEAGRDGVGNHYFPPPLPQRTEEYQQTTINYVEYLAENGVSDIQGEIFDNHYDMPSGSKLAEPSLDLGAQKVRYLCLQNEEAPVDNFTSTEHDMHIKKQEPNVGHQNDAHPHSKLTVSTSPFSPKRRRSSRQKATAAGRRRRMRISAAFDALQEQFPNSKEGNKENLLDDIMDHIKNLQLRMKELSENRLGGETSLNPCIFLEGYGHYLIQENMPSEPLEEMMGMLLEVNSLAATQLLESRGLFMMPMTYGKEFYETT